MTYLIAVFAFPLLVAALSLGVGLLLEACGRWRVPAPLLFPLGFAGIVGISQLVTYVGALAPATPYVVVLAALAGGVIGRRAVRDRWRARRTGWWWASAGGVAAYAIANLPVIAAGRATFPGYLLDTTGSIQLAGAERLVTDGHSWAPPGTGGYGLQLAGYFGNGYPSGSHSALGALGALVPVDYIWLYAPFLATAIAFTALVLGWIARQLGFARWAAAAAGCVAAVPALTYAYVLQGAIKEIAVLPILMLLGALVLLAREQWQAGPRGAIPIAATIAAGWGCIGLAFTPWAGVALLIVLAVVVIERGQAVRSFALGTVWRVLVLGGALVVLALPTVAKLETSLRQANGVTDANAAAVADPGNLLRPLLDVQVLGVWVSGSHRTDPGEFFRQTYLLIGVVAVALMLGLVWLVRRRRWIALAWIATSALVWVVLRERATDWTAAKLLVLLSPVVLLVAFAGAFGRLGSRRVEGVLLAAGIALGVLLSDAQLYHTTGLAPTARFDELHDIGERYAGAARPGRVTLVPDFDEYSTYLLRDMAPDSPGNARRAVPWTLADGSGIGYGMTVDVDGLAPDLIAQSDAVVVRRSPFKSRPPGDYARVFHGDYYDVWEREADRRAPLLRYIGGSATQPVAAPRCAAVRRFARSARAAGASSLTVAPRQPNVVANLAKADVRGGASVDAVANPPVVGYHGPAVVTLTVDVPVAGRYRLWVQGNTGRELVARVDGRPVGAVSNDSGGIGNVLEFGEIELAAGRHTITLSRGGGTLRPGDADATVLFGVALAPRSAEAGELRTVPLAQWRSLCGESVDWIEAY